jgi:hypothetical protein
MTSSLKLALIATTAATVFAGSAAAQTSTSGQTNQDRLGAVVGALFGDRLGLSAMDQAWLRGARPLSEGRTQFTSRVDASLRSGAISSSAATRLRADYDALVTLESQHAGDGRFSTEERADLNTRYTTLTQTLDAGAAGYGDANQVAQGRADFEARVDAAVAARRITRLQATQLKTDYQSLIQVETGYQADGSISAAERTDLDTRLDALDARVGDGPAGQTPTTRPATIQSRLSSLDAAVTTAERSGSVTRAEAADIRVELGDLVRLQAAYGRYAATADDTAYLERRVGELEARVRR